MPAWYVPTRSYDLPRNIAFLDTNVLVAMFDRNDFRHGDAVAAIDMGEFRWCITSGIIVEAWNFIVGKIKRRDFAIAMMNWVLTPGNVILIDDAAVHIETAHRYSQLFKIDIVDAGIVDIANRITNVCNVVPFVHVATYDARDFLRLFGREDILFHVYDMRDLTSTAEA